MSIGLNYSFNSCTLSVRYSVIKNLFFPKYLKCGFTYLNNLKIKQKRFILIKIYLPKLSHQDDNKCVYKQKCYESTKF